ncbi:MAG: hypothetical protein Q8L88_10520 [Bacteroidota bacterium]|nr:hypothetical protein [Bacteroidota bacterium]
MKTHNEQPRKSGSFLSGAATPGKQSDWWKHNHPNITKPNGSTAFTNNVKTGFWKTYNVRNSGKK